MTPLRAWDSRPLGSVPSDDFVDSEFKETANQSLNIRSLLKFAVDIPHERRVTGSDTSYVKRTAEIVAEILRQEHHAEESGANTAHLHARAERHRLDFAADRWHWNHERLFSFP